MKGDLEPKAPYTSELTQVNFESYDYDEIALSTVSPQQARLTNCNPDYFFTTVKELSEIGAKVDKIKRALFYPNAPRAGKVTAIIDTTHRDIASAFEVGIEDSQERSDLLHAALGKVTESIEFLEYVIKGMTEGFSEDVMVGLIEEAGDSRWYGPLEIRALDKMLGGFTELDCLVLNNLKLGLRMKSKGVEISSAFNSVLVLDRNVELELGPIRQFVQEKSNES